LDGALTLPRVRMSRSLMSVDWGEADGNVAVR
jgi:hypothetical protein